MHIAVTGGTGFLGARLARELLAAGPLSVAGRPARPLSRLTLIDRAPAPSDLAADDRVSVIRGDLTDLFANVASARDTLDDAEAIFHLAAAVSGESEADFDLGLRANLQATQELLASARALGTTPVVVFSSSVAVFGGSAAQPLPAVITDDTRPNPQSSYGAQKAMCEYLLADYTRKGFVNGRAVRLMTVSVRPGRPNAAASSFLSGIVREPLAGERAVCPVSPDTAVALASPAKAVNALLCAATASDQDWADPAPLTMPALTVTVAEMVAALDRVAGPAAAELIDYVPDPAIAGIVANWPARVRADRAARLGLSPDPDYDTVIRAYQAGT